MSFIIAIDGPSGSGKSTVGKALAARLGFTYIDTGAMYRAVALDVNNRAIAPDDHQKIEEAANQSRIEFKIINDVNRTILNDVDVSDAIRQPPVSMLSSDVSALPGVRKALLKLQRRMGETGNVILDGRDIGTVVFPNADCKFFLDASLEARGGRRFRELAQKQTSQNLDATIEEMSARDKADSERAEAPLKKADDAIYVDTTKMSIDDVVSFIEKTARKKLDVDNADAENAHA